MSARSPCRRHSQAFRLQRCAIIRNNGLARREAQKTRCVSTAVSMRCRHDACWSSRRLYSTRLYSIHGPVSRAHQHNDVLSHGCVFRLHFPSVPIVALTVALTERKNVIFILGHETYCSSS